MQISGIQNTTLPLEVILSCCGFFKKNYFISFECIESLSEESSKPYHIKNIGIFLKIIFYSLNWGLGTALGELPPYLFAKSINAISETPIRRLSISRTSMDFANSFDLQKVSTAETSTRGLKERISNSISNLIQNWGFFGILLMASVYHHSF